eukprot:gene7739-8579_t
MKVNLGLFVVISLTLLEVAEGAKTVVSPSYVWPLRYIYNGTVPVFPPLTVHGNLTKEDISLKFDGKTSWLDAGELLGSCISQPQTCGNGLSVVIRVKINDDKSFPQLTSSTPRFFFDSGGFHGEGASIYLQSQQLVAQVADKKRVWKVSSEISKNTWHFVLLTWSSLHGLSIFIDGPLQGQSSQSASFQSQPIAASSNHVVIGKCNSLNENTFAGFSSDLVAVFDSVSPDGKVYLSYSFSAPTTRGNIRHVNAKFINSADYDLIIFPDRGEHQSTGYQLEARSSTLLEYVLREGPLPVGMSFRLQNKKNGEQLTFQGKNTLHVISSDDKQVVTGFKIEQDGSIRLITSTSAVSINYQIKPAQVSSEKEIHAAGTMSTSPVQKLPEKPTSESLLTDNPESPEGEESNGNVTIIVPTTISNGTVNQTEAISTTARPSKLPPHRTTGIPPTIPPPTVPAAISKPTPVFKKPDVSNTTVNASGSASGSNGTSITGNATAASKNVSNAGLNATTTTRPSLNNTRGNKTGEVHISSPEMPEEEEQFQGIEVGDNAAMNITGDLELPNENATEGAVTVNNATKNYTNVKEVKGNQTLAKNASSTEKNTTEGVIRPGEEGEGRPVVTSSVSPDSKPNPWTDVANQTQQRLKPIPWENGRGAYNVLHNMAQQAKLGPNQNGGGMATTNYNAGKDSSRFTSNSDNYQKPVWQYINGQPVTGEWFGENQHLTGQQQQNSGTSPFKFANAKTQEQIESYYKQDLGNNGQPVTSTNAANAMGQSRNKIKYVNRANERQKNRQVL